MKRFIIAAAFVAASGLLPVAVRAASPTVVISEVAWAGSSKSTADEWLELTNVSDAAVDLSGFTVEGAGTSGTALTIPAGSTLASHQTFLISNYAADNASSALAAPARFVTTAVSLSNSALGLTLKDAAGNVLDRAGDGKTPKAGRAATLTLPFASMIRLDPTTDGTTAGAWATASLSNGFDAGVNDLGTPGAMDFVFAPPPVVLPPEEPAPTPQPEPEPAVIAAPAIIQTEPAAEAAPIVPEVAPRAPETTVLTPADTATIPDPAPVQATVTEPTAAPTDTPEPVVTVAPETPEPVTAAPTPDVPPPTSETLIEDVTLGPIAPEPTPEPVATEPTIETFFPNVTATQTASPSIAIALVTTPPGTLLVNELYPAPAKGEDEWVEIVNPFNNVIPLLGWKIREGSGKLTPLPDQLLGMGQFVTVVNPAGKLNNDGDTVALLDPSGAVIDTVTYGTVTLPAPKSGQALARAASGALVLTLSPTPNATNRIVAPVTKAKAKAVVTAQPAPTIAQMPTVASAPIIIYETPDAIPVAEVPVPVQPAVPAPSQPTAVPAPVIAQAPVFFPKPVVTPVAKPKAAAAVHAAAVPARMTLANVRTLKTGKLVLVTAIVSAAPGPLGKQVFAVTDDTAGLQVERPSGSLATLAVGDQVSIYGTVRISNGIRRIVLPATSGLTVLGHDEPVSALTESIHDLNDTFVGRLVTVRGVATAQRTSVITLSADDAELAIRLSPGDATTVGKGLHVSATGILTSTDSGLRLQLRTHDDLVVEVPPAPAIAATAVPALKPQADNGLRLIAASVVVLGALAVKSLIPILKARYVSSHPLRLAAQETH